MTEPLPTRAELNPYDDLDGRIACENFLGQTLDDAVRLFQEQPLYYQSDLMWMGVAAFRFYFPAVAQFIRSEGASDNSDFIAHFASTLESRWEREPDDLLPIAEHVIALCDYITTHWSRFEKHADAYGDVLDRYLNLRQTIASSRSNSAPNA
jgi:hypothetical protein